MILESFGWNSFFEAHFAPFRDEGIKAGRVAVQHRDRYVLYTADGELWAHVTGKFRHEAGGPQDFPAVGDWVAVATRPKEGESSIHALLHRKSKISRKVAGSKTDEQILAANIDLVFLVMGLDADFNLRRLERSVAIAWESGAQPVVVLNKADLCSTVQQYVTDAAGVAAGVTIVAMSAREHEGINGLKKFLSTGKTAVFIGTSGVGKSTITNLLLGQTRQEVADVRSTDGKGRHTTTRRELLLLPNGGLIIDSPGIRELQLWGTGEGLSELFDDVESLARQCRFNDCAHENEPDCAVREALERGTLDQQRWKSYVKLQRELHYLHLKQDEKAARLEKEKWKLMRIPKEKMKRRYKD